MFGNDLPAKVDGALLAPRMYQIDVGKEARTRKPLVIN